MKYHLIFEMSGFDPENLKERYNGSPDNINSFLETRLRTFAREMLNVQCNGNSKYITDTAIENAIKKGEIYYQDLPKSKKVITMVDVKPALENFIKQLSEIGKLPVEVPLRKVKSKSQDAQTKVYATSINPRRDIEAKLREFASLD